MRDIALYIHVPFCASKCAYCSFYSVLADDSTKEKYLKALKHEIMKNAMLLKEEKVSSIYIGGGTPSVMPCSFFTEIKKTLNEVCIYSKNLEFTVEVNPNSFNEKLAKTLKGIGVNRLSMGLQVANDKILKSVGRLHTAKEFVFAAKTAKKYFPNFSVDLIIGFPSQSKKDIKRSIKLALKSGATHISAYGLILEEGTPLFKNNALLKLLPSEEKQIKMHDFLLKTLKKKGFDRYEVSNFALKDKNDKYISHHNKTYWMGGDYLGLGPAAHSYIDGERFANEDNLNAYLLGKHKILKERLTIEQKTEERIMLGLRCKWGVEKNICNLSECEMLKNSGFIKEKNGRIYATKKGFYVLNLLIEKLI